jgi:hypothetical protein
MVRLISTAQLEPNVPASYCALSHCWGKTVDVKLTRANLDAMKMIQIQTLPKNFQDAVKITGQLRTRYLWIDSLCIVQDDAQEWEAQSTKMGLVYTNVKCVISATASKDSTGGCFQSRNLDYNDCLLYESESKVLKVCTLQRSPQLPALFKTLVENAPLAKRAWAFQERYLASRTLHFCNGLVLFECNAVIASALDKSEQRYSVKANVQADGKLHARLDVEQVEKPEPTWSPPPPNFDKITLLKHRHAARKGWERRRKIRPQYTAQLEKQAAMLKASARLCTRGAFEFLWRFTGTTLIEKIEFHNSWFELVQQYSTRQLTFGTDKAMAMAGIASCIQQNTGLNYAAGLWTEMLPFNLLWIAPNNPGSRPVRSVPSWSWTSVDGKISHPLNVYENETRNLYKYRQRLNGGKLFRSNWDAIKPLISSESLLEEDAVNGLIHKATLKLSGHICKLDMSKINVSFDTSEHPSVGELHFLPVLSFQNASLPPKTKATQIHGIILRQRPDLGSRYERVGYFWTVDTSLTVEGLAFQGPNSAIEIV